MPLSQKGRKILSAMKSEYGGQKGTSVFYASANAQKIKGVHNVKKDCGFYGHFSAEAMKNNVIKTTGGCKEVGQNRSEKHDGHFQKTIHSKHDVSKGHSAEVA